MTTSVDFNVSAFTIKTGNVSNSDNSKKTSDDAFSKVMDKSMKERSEVSKTQSARHNDKTDDVQTDDYDKDTDNDIRKTEYDEKQPVDKLDENSDRMEIEDTEGNKFGEDSGGEQLQDDNLQAIVQVAQTFVNKLVEFVEEKLGMTSEELTMAIDKMGIELNELMQEPILKDLIVNMTGNTDLYAVLTDEGLANNINQLNDFINNPELEEMLGMSLEELSQSIPDELVLKNNEVIISDKKFELDMKADNLNFKVNDEIQMDNPQMNKVNVDNNSDNSNESGLTDGETSGDSIVSDMKDITDAKENSIISYETFINNLNNAVNNNIKVEGTNDIQQVIMRQIVEQIVDKIDVKADNDITTITMQLNPENLGKVRVEISSNNGEVNTKFLVENQTVKAAVEAQLEILKEKFDSMGMKVNEVEVSIADYNLSESSNNQMQQGNGGFNQEQKRRRVFNADVGEDIKIDSELMDMIKEFTGSSVSFSA